MRTSFNYGLLAILIVLFFSCTDSEKGTDTQSTTNRPASDQPIYKDKSYSVEERIQDLLPRMTVEEKVAQTLGMWKKDGIFTDSFDFDEAAAAKVFKNGWGQIARPSERSGIEPGGNRTSRTAREMAEFTNQAQKFFIEKTRLGIPVLFHEEALHGHAAAQATSYPQPIGLAGTWDTTLVRHIYSKIAEEVRARGAQQVLTPVVDVARDARWGRVEETFGEDPFLVSQMGLASVRGFQGMNGYKGIDKKHVAATLKHFAAHGQPEAGTNIGPALYDERTIAEVFLYPFEVGVKQGHALSLMASYNEIGGVPSHGSRRLLTDILRDQWGFNGYVVSDYYGIQELAVRHNVAADSIEAAAMALYAGVEVELPDTHSYPRLVELVKNGDLEQSVLDTAVARILRIKFLCGLFDDPYTDPDLADKIVNTADRRELAIQAARQTITLLKNDKNVLPIDTTKVKRLAVIGPNADRVLMGGYSGKPMFMSSPLAGIKKRAGSLKVSYAEGVRITEPGGDYFGWFNDTVTLATPADNRKRMAQAVQTARSSDMIVLCLGQNEQITREAWSETHYGRPLYARTGGRAERTLYRPQKAGQTHRGLFI